MPAESDVPQAHAHEWRVQRATAADGSDWDAFVRAHPAHSVMHLRALCDLQATWKAGPERSLIARASAGDVVAVLPLFLFHRRVLRFWRAARLGGSAFSGSGPLLHPSIVGNDRDRLLALLEQSARRLATAEGAQGLDIALPAAVGEDGPAIARGRYHPFRPLGWREELTPVLVADLAPPVSELLAACRQSTRSLIRKSIAAGLRTRPVSGPDEWLGFDAANRWTQGEAALSPAAMRLVWDALIAPGVAFALCVEYDGTPISAVVVTAVNGVARYMLAFNSPEAHRLAANRLALWDAMQEAKRRGLRWFELGPVYWGEGKEATIAAFKASFGADIWYQSNARLEVTPLRNAALETAVQGYRALRGLGR